MVYSTSKCPNCGQVIRRQTNPVHEIGSPFEQCRYCRSVYLNSYKEEWITKSPIERFFFYLQVYVWARALMMPGLVIGAMAFLDMEINGKVIAVLWPILSVAWLIAGYFIHKKANREDIEASLERTKDPEYVKQLQNAGFGIYPIANDKTSNNTKNVIVNNIKSSTVTNSTPKTETVPVAVSNENGSNSDSREGFTVQKEDIVKEEKKSNVWKLTSILLMLALIISIVTGGFGIKTGNLKKQIAELEISNSSYETTNTSLNSRIKALTSENEAMSEQLMKISAKANFYDEFAVIQPDDGTKMYHKYDCAYLDTSFGFWIYNVEAAEHLRACPYCMK